MPWGADWGVVRSPRGVAWSLSSNPSKGTYRVPASLERFIVPEISTLDPRGEIAFMKAVFGASLVYESADGPGPE